MRSTILALLVVLASLAVSNGATNRYVFAHYMMGFSYPSNQTYFENAIRKAAALGIDAFALNLGRNDWQVNRTELFFAAAANTNLGFKLFFSFDMGDGGGFQNGDSGLMTQYVNTYWNHPSYFNYRGRPFVSTFAGENRDFNADTTGSSDFRTRVNSGWTNWKKNLTSAIYFCPSFTGSGPPDVIWSSFTTMDCHFAWDMWAQSGKDRSVVSDQAFANGALNANKQWMAGVSPNFYVRIPEYSKYWVWGSERLWTQRWEQMIYLKPDLVEIATWNDYSEAHYINTPDPEEVPGFCQEYILVAESPYNQAMTYDHSAWGLLAAHYISWYKTGIRPDITRDQFYWWSRPHPKSQARNDTEVQLKGPNFLNTAPPDDWVYFHAITKVPQQYQVIVEINGVANITTLKSMEQSLYVPYTSAGGPINITIVFIPTNTTVYSSVSPLAIEPSGQYPGAIFNYNMMTSSWSQPAASLYGSDSTTISSEPSDSLFESDTTTISSSTTTDSTDTDLVVPTSGGSQLGLEILIVLFAVTMIL